VALKSSSDKEETTMPTDYTAQEYVTNFIPQLAAIFSDPAQAYREMTLDAARLATRLELPVSPEGRYRRGIWDIISDRLVSGAHA
jgi:hypothetical protein